MKYLKTILALLVLQITSLLAYDLPTGDWSGDLQVGEAKLTLVLHFSKDPENQLAATLDCPQQGLSALPVDALVLKKDSLTFELPSLQATFNGLLNQNEISGQFTQYGTALPITFVPGVTVAELRRPQEPKRPFPYLEEEVVFENKAAGVTLSGTLTLPNTKDPFPAVILIAGSGPFDRNEAFEGHKHFLVLSDHLTKKGIAVLRCDKRGVGESTGNYETATTLDFASDVHASVEYLKKHKGIVQNKIGLIGHSEGGAIATIVGAESTDIAFIVSMAGPGVTGEEVLYLQGKALLRASGETEKKIESYRHFQEQAFLILRQEPDADRAEKMLFDTHVKYLCDVPEEMSREGAKRMNTPWLRLFLTFNPETVLKQVKVPYLALNGELDLQVTPKENLSAIEKALKEGGNDRVTIHNLPRLNHAFQTCRTGSPAEYREIEETMAPQALNIISDWVLKQTQP